MSESDRASTPVAPPASVSVVADASPPTAPLPPINSKVLFRVNDWPLEAELVPDKATVVLGEPIFFRVLVRNLGKARLYEMAGGNSLERNLPLDAFTVAALDASGRPTADPRTKDSMFAGNYFWGPMAPNEKGAWKSDLHLQAWADIDAPGAYVIRVGHLVSLTTRQDPDAPTANTRVELTAGIHVLPPDQAVLGHVIDTYAGATVLGKDDFVDSGPRKALYALTLIRDSRVVPYLAEAVDKGTYAQRMKALGGLGAYGGDTAFAAMQHGLADSDDGIAHAAAIALGRSPDPRAIDALWALHASGSDGVRNAIVHALGARSDATSTARLREMTTDPVVGTEAQRYLSLRLRAVDAGAR